MIRIRYMLVDHHCSHDGQVSAVGEHPGSYHTHVPDLIHKLVPHYHWARLDDNTIFVKATYFEMHHNILMQRRNVTVLPATFSRRPVSLAIHEQSNLHHHGVLQRHCMPYHDQTMTADLVDWIAVHHGSVFDHDQ